MEQLHPATGHYTVAEYLALEEQSEAKHEYRDGEILDMAGANDAHLQIVHNLGRRLGEQLDGSACVVRGSDLRVRTDRTRYCYPDQTIACRPLLYDPPDGDVVLTNPLVIFEVLSPSTESVDRGEKFGRYRRIASLREYLLVSQDRARVEPFYRQPDGVWAIGGIVDGLGANLALRSVPVELTLAQLFADVTFPAEASGTSTPTE